MPIFFQFFLEKVNFWKIVFYHKNILQLWGYFGKIKFTPLHNINRQNLSLKGQTLVFYAADSSFLTRVWRGHFSSKTNDRAYRLISLELGESPSWLLLLPKLVNPLVEAYLRTHLNTKQKGKERPYKVARRCTFRHLQSLELEGFHLNVAFQHKNVRKCDGVNDLNSAFQDMITVHWILCFWAIRTWFGKPVCCRKLIENVQSQKVQTWSLNPY